MSVIYALVDSNTKEVRYIGKTKDIDKRMAKHCKPSQLKRDDHKSNWIRKLVANGQKPEVVILEAYDDPHALNEAEKDCIALCRSLGFPLTNGTSGGDGGTMNPEAIERMRQTKIGRKASEETKARMSASQKGHPSYNLGMHHTEEAKRKISEKGKGRKCSDETKAKQSKAHKGKHQSEETKAKTSKRLMGNKYKLGHKDSEDTKKKKSAAAKAGWLKR